MGLKLPNFSKWIRDEVLGYVGLTAEELDVVQSPYFQRLRRIKQLDVAELVYPGASHNRFAHSLGVMEIATRMFSQLKPCISSEGTSWTIDAGHLRLAALLHDLGHYALSHCGESALGEDLDKVHETIAYKILCDSETGMVDLLESAVGAFGGDSTTVADVIVGDGYPDTPNCIFQILSSDLDADRLDYLARDSHHTGVSYGTYDLDRLLRMIRLDDDRMVIDEGGIHAVEAYMIARYEMYNQVYFHKTVVSFGLIARKVMGRLIEARVYPSYGEILECPSVLMKVDDNSFWNHVRMLAKGDEVNKIQSSDSCRELCKNLLNRIRIPIAFEHVFRSSPIMKRERMEKYRAHLNLEEHINSTEFESFVASTCKKNGVSGDLVLKSVGMTSFPRSVPESERASADEDASDYEKRILILAQSDRVRSISAMDRSLIGLLDGCELCYVRVYAPDSINALISDHLLQLTTNV